jgi:hypothetical protein
MNFRANQPAQITIFNAWRSSIIAPTDRALLRRQDWQANHERVLRLMREDNLCAQASFVPTTTNSRRNGCVVPNFTRGIVLNGLDQLWGFDPKSTLIMKRQGSDVISLKGTL